MPLIPTGESRRSRDTPLPSSQHAYDGLPELPEATLHARRESVFLAFAGLFLGTLAMLNILGISRFIRLFELDLDGNPETGATVFAVAVGVLPYPITFLCTDFISELYGRHRASLVVWIGLVLNLWVITVLWLGGVLPGFETVGSDGVPVPDIAQRLQGDDVVTVSRPPVFFEVRALAFGAVTASMLAYLTAQFVDVHVFHFWKRVTKGRYLWLRNNGSTLVSQLIDTTAVILISFALGALAGVIDPARDVTLQLVVLIATGYAFKVVFAMIDTVPFYLGVPLLNRYLRLPPPTG
ncbi:MAG: queuosine precursor transporter [Phycisphaerales bacterium JB040]